MINATKNAWLFQIVSDGALTYASSRVALEHLVFEDPPGQTVTMDKVTDVTVRFVAVRVTCSLPGTTVTNLLGALAMYTDGIDIWGSNVHIHDVEIRNSDDCICVKGHDDGSRIWSENWLVENSSATGEGLSVGTVSNNFITRNVTFNIVMKDTRKGIYVKTDSEGTSTSVLYQNITIEGHTLQFPVFIGPNHQFFHGSCDSTWPFHVPKLLPEANPCYVRNRINVSVTIDGLRITNSDPGRNGVLTENTADLLVIGNAQSDVNVQLANVCVAGPVTQCSNPPVARLETCNNACFGAHVVTDGSYNITCVSAAHAGAVAAGVCAPMIGSVAQRCESAKAGSDTECPSGQRCA